MVQENIVFPSPAQAQVREDWHGGFTEILNTQPLVHAGGYCHFAFQNRKVNGEKEPGAIKFVAPLVGMFGDQQGDFFLKFFK